MSFPESRAALGAISFLTRIPVPVELTGEDMRRAGAYFPLVGAGMGALTGGTARRFGGPAAVGVATALTGALHLDALADSADALGTRDRARALEIMRDSRIGSFGTAALCLDLLIKSAALERNPEPLHAAIGAGALSRAVPVLLSATLPYARPAGTGQAITGGGRTRAVVALALACAVCRDRAAVLVAGAVGAASGAFWRRRIGGVTGDTLGASVELTETALLLWSSRR